MSKPEGLFKLSQESRIIYSLTLFGMSCVGAEVFLVWAGKETSEGLITLAAAAVGGIAGMAVPQRDNKKEENDYDEPHE